MVEVNIVADSLQAIVQEPEVVKAISLEIGNLQELRELSDSDLGWSIALIVFAALFGVFFLPAIVLILVVWLIIRYKQKENKLRAEIATKVIESGSEQTIPDNLFEKEKKNPLKKGIIWVSVGVGIALFFVFLGLAYNDYADIFTGLAISMIPLFVGLGYLLIHFLDKKTSTKK